jgi:hypothetical protein
VDPVKLYEYLALRKEVIAVRYPEIGRFESFIHLYKTATDFVETVRNFSAGTLTPKNTGDTVSQFLRQNTWDSRLDQVVTALRQLR